jgi:hypothetical protein
VRDAVGDARPVAGGVTLRRYLQWMVAVAATLFVVMFFEVRTPGTIGLLMLLFLPFAFVAVFGSGAIALGRWPEWSWRGLLPTLVCAAAFIGGIQVGGVARDSRFFRWRKPIYEQVVARLRDRWQKTPDDPRWRDGDVDIELKPEEKEAAILAFASLDEAGAFVVQFLWAGQGPPPMHFTYWYVESDRFPESEQPHWAYLRLAPCWFEASD